MKLADLKNTLTANLEELVNYSQEEVEKYKITAATNELIKELVEYIFKGWRNGACEIEDSKANATIINCVALAKNLYETDLHLLPEDNVATLRAIFQCAGHPWDAESLDDFNGIVSTLTSFIKKPLTLNYLFTILSQLQYVDDIKSECNEISKHLGETVLTDINSPVANYLATNEPQHSSGNACAASALIFLGCAALATTAYGIINYKMMMLWVGATTAPALIVPLIAIGVLGLLLLAKGFLELPEYDLGANESVSP